MAMSTPASIALCLCTLASFLLLTKCELPSAGGHVKLRGASSLQPLDPSPSAPHRSLLNSDQFVRRSGWQLIKNGQTFYANGFNAYWLMYIATDPNQKPYVAQVLQQAKQMGLTVARSWAYYDGNGWHALQTSPGVYSEDTFKALDYVIATAGGMGIKLHLALTNNWADFGGKPTYLAWASAAGSSLPKDDTAFFVDPLCKQYYKNFVKAVLLRRNTITGVLYRDDPNIFGWDLINEPRINSDPSGNVLQAWIVEMAAFVKSVDPNHLLSVGAEGFYGFSSPQRQNLNAESWMANVGTDFIRNNQAPGIDIASIHAYSNSRPSSTWDGQLSYFTNWIKGHMEDCQRVLRMPLLVGEFGPGTINGAFGAMSYRNQVYNATYNLTLTSARAGGAGAAAFQWQLLPDGLSSWDDGTAVFYNSQPSTVAIITAQSKAISLVGDVSSGQLVWRRGVQLVQSGRPFYVNGFNAYWLMYIASIPDQRHYVVEVLQQAKQMGLTVARSWAYYDGNGWHALQTSPGVYSEDTFKALDYVIAAAGRIGIQLHLGLTNNWGDFGGKDVYVSWAKAAGSTVPNDDTAFFKDTLCRQFYKNFVKAILLRRNTITGVVYRDDPTIFGWDLIHEPRVTADPSGSVLQAWIAEMAAFVKSLDTKHLLSVGSEGFYGPSSPQRQFLNAETWMANVGTDFIRNNQAAGIDIASVHAFLNSKTSASSSWSGQLSYYTSWIKAHIDDCQNTLKMPLLLGEFGPDPATNQFGGTIYRDQVYNSTYSLMLASARAGQAGAVSMFRQLLSSGLASWDDGTAIFVNSQPSTVALITAQSKALL